MKFLKEFDPEDRAYCRIAAAVLGAGALSAGASMWGASKAADAQTAAANASIQNQQQMYEKNRQILMPFISGGQGAMTNLSSWTDPNNANSPLASLIKLTTPGADMSDVLSKTPGYQFAQSQGQRAIMNALAGRGLGGSPGAIATNVGNFTNGLASTTWGNVVNALQGVWGGETNALQGLVTSGVNAGNSLAGQGTNTASNISSAITGAGNAQAASYNAMGSAIGGLGNSASTAALIQQLTSGGGGSVYGNIGNMPATGAGAPSDAMSNMYALSQGINPFA